MTLLAGNSNRSLAEAMSAFLDLPLTKARVRRFSDMEIFVEIDENVRGEDVFLIQSTSYPANDNVMELLIAMDALKRGSARRITAGIPYYGYARQDRKSGPPTPIPAKPVAHLLPVPGPDRVTYGGPDSSCDAATSPATWTRGAPVRADNLLIRLSDAVRDESGLPLDGNWIDGTSEFPSGNGVKIANTLVRRCAADP